MAKKTFKNVDNPAMRFISSAEETEERESRTEQAPSAPTLKGFTPRTEKAETKSRRLQLLLKPSVYEGIKQVADESELSVNDLINQILEEVLKGE